MYLAIMAKVIGREQSTEVTSSEQYTKENQNPQMNDADSTEMEEQMSTVKYDIQIQAIFKRTPLEYATTNTILRRGPMTWIIPVKNLECRCPKIKMNKYVFKSESFTIAD